MGVQRGDSNLLCAWRKIPSVTVRMNGLRTPPLDEDIHLLADIDRHLTLIKLADNLQHAGVDPIGAVSGEGFLRGYVRLDPDEAERDRIGAHPLDEGDCRCTDRHT